MNIFKRLFPKLIYKDKCVKKYVWLGCIITIIKHK